MPLLKNKRSVYSTEGKIIERRRAYKIAYAVLLNGSAIYK